MAPMARVSEFGIKVLYVPAPWQAQVLRQRLRRLIPGEGGIGQTECFQSHGESNHREPIPDGARRVDGF